jgi:hypothetical protein
LRAKLPELGAGKFQGTALQPKFDNLIYKHPSKKDLKASLVVRAKTGGNRFTTSAGLDKFRDRRNY